MQDDYCVWEKFESIFHANGYGVDDIDGTNDYSQSYEGEDRHGQRSLHYVLVINIILDGTHAITKMKGTITQRLNLDNFLVDADPDCRFLVPREEEG